MVDYLSISILVVNIIIALGVFINRTHLSHILCCGCVESECNKLFKFSLLCAERTPEITYIWRLHPILSFEKLQKSNFVFKNLPDNIVLSKDTIENDIARSSWALYRGTTAIYKAMSLGLRPIYLQDLPEMTIDPLHEMSDWRTIIDTSDEFVECVKNDIVKEMYFHNINLDMARAVCEKQFSKVNVSALTEIISDSYINHRI